MIRKYVLTALAIGGIVLAILTVISGNRQAPVAAPVVQPPKAPFESYVAGAGIVEASTRNIAIGCGCLSLCLCAVAAVLASQWTTIMAMLN